jgi:hypothetical protein
MRFDPIFLSTLPIDQPKQSELRDAWKWLDLDESGASLRQDKQKLEISYDLCRATYHTSVPRPRSICGRFNLNGDLELAKVRISTLNDSPPIYGSITTNEDNLRDIRIDAYNKLCKFREIVIESQQELETSVLSKRTPFKKISVRRDLGYNDTVDLEAFRIGRFILLREIVTPDPPKGRNQGPALRSRRWIWVVGEGDDAAQDAEERFDELKRV